MNSRYTVLWITSLLLLGALLTGCTRIAVSEEAELTAEKFEPAPGYGSVYIVREKTLAGMLVDIGVDVNGQFIGNVNIGTYYLLQLKPGRYTISAYSQQAKGHKAVEVVEVSVGESYFIQVEPVGGFSPKASAEPIDADLGRELVIKGTGLKTPPLVFKEGLQFSLPTDRKWITGYAQAVEGKYTITELVPEGETVQNWSELITIQNFAGMSGTPENLFEQLKAIRERTCPGSTKWTLIEKDDRSILYEWRATPCAGYPDQHEISRIIDGNWNRFRIAYTAKVSEISAEKRDIMIQSLSEATIEIEQQ